MKYWPSIWRGAFYFSIEVATVWHKELSALVKDHQFPVLCTADWVVMGLASFIAGAMAVRAYFDGTHGRLLNNLQPTTTITTNGANPQPSQP